jgi:hypothetical protein
MDGVRWAVVIVAPVSASSHILWLFQTRVTPFSIFLLDFSHREDSFRRRIPLKSTRRTETTYSVDGTDRPLTTPQRSSFFFIPMYSQEFHAHFFCL